MEVAFATSGAYAATSSTDGEYGGSHAAVVGVSASSQLIVLTARACAIPEANGLPCMCAVSYGFGSLLGADCG